MAVLQSTFELVSLHSVIFTSYEWGLLAKELRKREYEINKNSQTKIKIIEDGGVQLKKNLGPKDPFPILKCEQQKCILCKSEKSENMKFACNSNNKVSLTTPHTKNHCREKQMNLPPIS